MAIIADFLVIGSGLAGLFFALRTADHGRVVLVTKKGKAESNTNYAQGGIAAVFGKDDSFEMHVRDTIQAGAGLCHEEAVRAVVEEGPRLVEELIALGVSFSREGEELSLGREGGHSRRRIVHAKDRTGQGIEQTLISRVEARPEVALYPNHIAIDLITDRSARTCWGAYVLDTKTGKVESFLARSVLLATGGLGAVYLHTTNPAIATGDGVAMAYRAGARIANMEFIQFHPTALCHPKAGSFLISETVRGEGGVLRLKSGEAFMEKYHELKDLAPRDVVARAIDRELKKSGEKCVLLDLSAIPAEKIKSRFPQIYERCLALGLDITKEPIPVVPAAHYSCGGVMTDLWGRTNLANLFSAGETASTGVHGANRLASNSLLEALVFASRAAQVACEAAKDQKTDIPELPAWDYVGSVWSEEAVVVAHNREEIRRTMWDYVGIVRSDLRLKWALKRIQTMREEIREYYWRYRATPDLAELRNLVTVADLVVQSALLRKESRGLHYTLDYPFLDDENWKRDTVLESRG
jgi:L-aspartate oxidase